MLASQMCREFQANTTNPLLLPIKLIGEVSDFSKHIVVLPVVSPICTCITPCHGLLTITRENSARVYKYKKVDNK